MADPLIKPDGNPVVGDREAELMVKYGITHVLVDRFHYKSYRYATLGDAIAQAKRDMPSADGDPAGHRSDPDADRR